MAFWETGEPYFFLFDLSVEVALFVRKLCFNEFALIKKNFDC